MDRLLRPEKFDNLPEDSESKKIFECWLCTFEGFIAAVAANAGENKKTNKLALLTNFLTHKTYSFIAQVTTYDEDHTSLTRAYHQQKSVAFARLLLMTRTQRSSEIIAEYFHSPQELARDFDFVQITAEQCRDELTRDVLVNGLASSSIRQYLLEVDDIDFKATIERETLDRAQRHFVFYSAPSTCSATATKQDAEPDSLRPPSLGSSHNRKHFYAPMLFLWWCSSYRRTKSMPSQI